MNTRPIHENASAFGPCAGPYVTHGHDASWYCQGIGGEVIDPLADTLSLVILCGGCYSLRDGLATFLDLEDAA